MWTNCSTRNRASSKPTVRSDAVNSEVYAYRSDYELASFKRGTLTGTTISDQNLTTTPGVL